MVVFIGTLALFGLICIPLLLSLLIFQSEVALFATGLIMVAIFIVVTHSHQDNTKAKKELKRQDNFLNEFGYITSRKKDN